MLKKMFLFLTVCAALVFFQFRNINIAEAGAITQPTALTSDCHSAPAKSEIETHNTESDDCCPAGVCSANACARPVALAPSANFNLTAVAQKSEYSSYTLKKHASLSTEPFRRPPIFA